MNWNKVNFKHLKLFIAVAELQSISKASNTVHLSQPAISQVIAKLEKYLKNDLFVRSSHGMILSKEGKLFYKRVKRAIKYIKIAIQKVKLPANKNYFYFIHFSQFYALIEIAQTNNLSVAAKNLNIPQPTLYHQIHTLENIFELKLYTKKNNTIELTPHGKIMTQYASLCLAELSQSQQDFSILQNLNISKINIGALPLSRSSILPNTIINFNKHYPQVSFNIVDGPYDNLLYELRHGFIDFIIGALREPCPGKDINQEVLFEDSLIIVSKTSHPLTKKKKIQLQDLLNYPWIVSSIKTPSRKHFEELFAKTKVKLINSLIETSSLILTRELLSKSNRLTIISSHQIQDEIKSGKLQILNYRLKHTSRFIGIAHRKNWYPSLIQKEFLNCLRKDTPKKIE